MLEFKEIDKRWRIAYETNIKAKSMKGFSTSTPKMVENKFVVGEETPELLDDWDQRTVTSVLEFHEAAEALGKRCCKFQTFEKIYCHVSDQVR